MTSIGNFFKGLGDILHPKKSSFSGAMDVIVIKDPENNLHSTNFYIKFGRFKVSKSDKKKVDLIINGEESPVLMELDKYGMCSFLRDSNQNLIYSKECEAFSSNNMEDLADFDLRINLLPSELSLLNLKQGMNIVHYSVHSKKQTILSAKIYLWDYRTKIVISDIDGTVSKSDILGYIYYFIGKDWKREGVVDLYKKLRRKGYQIVYLSARSLDTIDYTRGYLSWVQQDGKHLPDGPAILSPQGFWTSVKREIMKTTQQFKTDALKGIQRVFGEEFPFYAGFGNKNADAVAYLNVGLEFDKVFILEDNKGNEEFYRKIRNFCDILQEIEERFPEVEDYLYLPGTI